MKIMLCRQEGFTLLEAIVPLALLLIGVLATCSALFTFLDSVSPLVIGSRFNAHSNVHSEDRTIAASMAQLKMEEIKNTYYLSIVDEYPPSETLFKDEPLGEPYWTFNSTGEWITSLPEGR